MIIFTKFHKDRTKNVDFLLMVNFWMCLFFFLRLYFWWNLKSCLSWKKSPFQLSILLTGCLTNYFAWIHNAYVIFQFEFSGRGLVNFTMGVFFWEGMTFQPYLKEKYEVMLAIFTNQVLYLWELNFLLQFFKRVEENSPPLVIIRLNSG